MSGIYTQGPGAAERDTTLRDLLSVLFKRKWMILGIFAVTSTIIGVKTLTTPTTYSADATLLLNRQGARSSVLERNSRQLPWVEVVESEVEVMQSIPVLRLAQAKLLKGMDGEPTEIGLGLLAESISAGVIGESNVIFISGTSEDREIAKRITNAVAKSYVEFHEELFRLPNATSMIEARADSVFQLLELRENERAAIFLELGAGDIPHENRTLSTRRKQIEMELATARTEMARLRTQITDGQEYLESGSGALPFAENTVFVQGRALAEMLKKLRGLKADLRVLRDKYTEKHPQVELVASQVRGLEESVKEAVGEIVQTKRHELRVSESAATEREKELRRINQDLNIVLRSMGRLEILGTQINSLSRQYSILSEQSVDSEITGQSFRDYGVKVLSPALYAERNAKGDLIRIALGPILALMAGIGLAFYLENLDHSLTNREDVERHLEVPVLASFPDADVRDSEEHGEKVPFRARSGLPRGSS